MPAKTTPPEFSAPATPPPTPRSGAPAVGTPRPVVQRTITLRVDLRALAALGGALIIIGALLPWVTPLFQPFVRVFSPVTDGGWPLLLIGVLIIALLFTPRFVTPRVSVSAAVFGFAAGLLAVWSALNTIGLGKTIIGDQTVSPISGLGLGVYLTLAGSIIAVLAGLAPQSLTNEPARAEIRLWQPATAILASLMVVCVLGAVLAGFWLGNGGSTGRVGTPTPAPLDAGVLATPLINVEVNPLTSSTPGGGTLITPTALPPEPTATPLIQVEPTLTPLPTPTEPPTPTKPPSPTPTQFTSPLPTPTPSLSATPTLTGTPTSTSTPTPTGTPTPSATP